MQFLNKLQPLALLIVRLVAGAILFSHGWMKVAHASAAMKMFSGMGFPGWVGLAIGVLETLGGLLLVLGLLTRILGLVFFVEMSVAILFVHWRHAAWWNVGTYEPAVACWAMSLALAAFGAGAISIDRALNRS